MRIIGPLRSISEIQGISDRASSSCNGSVNLMFISMPAATPGAAIIFRPGRNRAEIILRQGDQGIVTVGYRGQGSIECRLDCGRIAGTIDTC